MVGRAMQHVHGCTLQSLHRYLSLPLRSLGRRTPIGETFSTMHLLLVSASSTLAQHASSASPSWTTTLGLYGRPQMVTVPP